MSPYRSSARPVEAPAYHHDALARARRALLRVRLAYAGRLVRPICYACGRTFLPVRVIGDELRRESLRTIFCSDTIACALRERRRELVGVRPRSGWSPW